jgi:hypothetical protein
MSLRKTRKGGKKKNKKNSKKKTAKGKRNTTVETRKELMKYNNITFMKLYEQYEDDFIDAVIDNTHEPINVEITCVNESKKYEGTILAINHNSDSAYNII